MNIKEHLESLLQGDVPIADAHRAIAAGLLAVLERMGSHGGFPDRETLLQSNCHQERTIANLQRRVAELEKCQECSCGHPFAPACPVVR